MLRRLTAPLGIALAALLVSTLAIRTAFADASPERKLEAAIQAKDVPAAESAIQDLAEKDDEASAKVILKLCARAAGVIDLEDQAAAALAGMKSEGAKKALTQAMRSTSDVEPARFLAMVALCRMQAPEAVDALIGAISDKDPFISGGAIRELKARATREVMGKMIDKLASIQKDKKLANVRRILVSALRDLSGKDDLEDAQDWKNWWASQGATFEPKVSKGGGKKDDDVVTRLRQNHPADFHTVERLAPDGIVVIRGRSDRCEDVLKSLKLPFKKIELQDLAGYKLEPRQVLVVNCNGGAEPPTDEDVKKIRGFVQDGGYLFSSDWSLKALVQRAFPEKLTYLRSTADATEVHIRAAPAAVQHLYNRDVFPLDPFKRANFTWKMHERSHMMKLGEGVTVLVEAIDYQDRHDGGDDKKTGKKEGGDKGDEGDGDDGGRKRGRHKKDDIRDSDRDQRSGASLEDESDGGEKKRGKRKRPHPGGGNNPTPGAPEVVPVAVTFRVNEHATRKRVESGPGASSSTESDLPTGGSVLHVLSHFQDQRSAEGDGFALQQLLLNFIVEKQRINAAASK